MTICSAHYRLSLAGGGTDFEPDGLCITLSLPWRCHVVRVDEFRPHASDAMVTDLDWGGQLLVSEHPILKHLPDVRPEHHFIVTHELPTRVGLGSSAALALATVAATDGFEHMKERYKKAQDLDHAATGAGWQDVAACMTKGVIAIMPAETRILNRYPEDTWYRNLLLFSTGGTHTTARNDATLDPLKRKLALAEAHRLRDDPTLETLAWCMNAQWERKMVDAPSELAGAIAALAHTKGFIAAKSTGSRGAGFGVVLTKDREGARDMLVERGARVWLV